MPVRARLVPFNVQKNRTLTVQCSKKSDINYAPLVQWLGHFVAIEEVGVRFARGALVVS